MPGNRPPPGSVSNRPACRALRTHVREVLDPVAVVVVVLGRVLATVAVQVEIGRVQANLLEVDCDRLMLDQLAAVSFSSQVDLGEFRSSDPARPVTYAERAASWEQRRGARVGRPSSGI